MHFIALSDLLGNSVKLVRIRNAAQVLLWSTCVYVYTCKCLQIAGRDILSTIDREMSGDLKDGFIAIGKWL
jgi:hypothetical protein